MSHPSAPARFSHCSLIPCVTQFLFDGPGFSSEGLHRLIPPQSEVSVFLCHPQLKRRRCAHNRQCAVSASGGAVCVHVCGAGFVVREPQGAHPWQCVGSGGRVCGAVVGEGDGAQPWQCVGGAGRVCGAVGAGDDKTDSISPAE
jgi:hypothetical protein